MSEQLEEKINYLKTMQENGDFEIAECEEYYNFKDIGKFQEIELNSEQKMQISEFVSHIPVLMEAGAMAKAYKVKFPKGMSHILMKYKTGGVGSSIIGEKGGIVGHAAFYSMAVESAVYGAFAVMSIATGQFFMCQINNELRQINRKLDEILQFMQDDKRYELFAEIKYLQSACNNYSSIMLHGEQREAVLNSIQEAKKLAIKDIGFFGESLDRKLKDLKKVKYFDKLKSIINELKPIRESYEQSLQLYIMSCIADVYFAQNYDKSYIDMVENDINDQYVEQCRQKIIEYYSKLDIHMDNIYHNFYKSERAEADKLKIEIADRNNEIINTYKDIYTKLDVLHIANKPQGYYVTKGGNVYRVTE
jgi:hypothetical protein